MKSILATMLVVLVFSLPAHATTVGQVNINVESIRFSGIDVQWEPLPLSGLNWSKETWLGAWVADAHGPAIWGPSGSEGTDWQAGESVAVFAGETVPYARAFTDRGNSFALEQKIGPSMINTASSHAGYKGFFRALETGLLVMEADYSIEIDLYNDNKAALRSINSINLSLRRPFFDIEDQDWILGGAKVDMDYDWYSANYSLQDGQEAHYSKSGTSMVALDFTEGEIGMSRIHGQGDQERPVPEPATMLLLGTGLIGLAVIGRRKVGSWFS